MTSAAPTDTAATARLREAARALGTLVRIALAAFASELALALLPDGPERDQGLRALGLATQLAAGEAISPDDIVDVMPDENDEDVMLLLQAACPKVEADIWATVVGMLGYAAYQAYAHAGEQPDGLVEGWKSPDAPDFCVDPFIGLAGSLDWDVLLRSQAYALQNGAKASDGWGRPLPVEELRRAALPSVAAPGRDKA